MEQIYKEREIKRLRRLGLVPNTLQQLLKEFPDKPSESVDSLVTNSHGVRVPWHWVYMSSNHNLSIQVLLDNKDRPWDYDFLSINGAFSFQDILGHPELPWVWQYVSGNPSVGIQDILDHPELPWVWENATRNRNISFQDMLDHPELPWVKSIVSDNNSISIEDVVGHPEYPWKFKYLSQNPGIKIQDIADHPELPWDWDHVSYNPDICIDDVVIYHDKPSESVDSLVTNSVRVRIPWNWNVLTRFNCGIKMKDILDHPELPWTNFEQYLVERTWKETKVNWRQYLDHPEQLQNHKYVSNQPDLTFEDIRDHSGLPSGSLDLRDANSAGVCLPSESLDSRDANPVGICFPWDWKELSYNQFELDERVIQSHIDKYKIKSEDKTFMNHLEAWQNHFKYQPEGEGAIQTIKDWNKKVKEVKKEKQN